MNIKAHFGEIVGVIIIACLIFAVGAAVYAIVTTDDKREKAYYQSLQHVDIQELNAIGEVTNEWKDVILDDGRADWVRFQVRPDGHIVTLHRIPYRIIYQPTK